ncbi:hypothetical protein Y032_0073g721 [Ancylostoma ceylanicum]|uniref:Tc1-like transposase DDE domain-containing protein n=1 Tax=Ancylostoma ceylanicum TaxID=53326 RepID=A0A016TVI1_9BILA|nr:hypothetical protein Y032_0073g721 [Ancylostoma ceylanicum]
MKSIFTVDKKSCLYVNIKHSPPWVDKDEQHEPQSKAGHHPLMVMISAWCDCKGIIHCEKLHDFGWEVLASPPYRPDPVPRDYQLLLALSNALQGRARDDDDDLDRWLSKFFESIPAQFYADGIQTLPIK